jgi:hypothetical protein
MKTIGSATKRLLISLGIGVLAVGVASAISAFAFIKPGMDAEAESAGVIRIYDDTNYDLKISNLSEDELNSIKTNSVVTKCVPFYSGVFIPEGDGYSKIKELEVLSVDNSDDLPWTEFSKKRAISLDENVTSNPIYLDYAYAKEHSLGIGSSIGNSSFVFTVAGIYSNYSKDLAYAPNLGTVVGKILKYQGVYVATSDKATLLSTLPASIASTSIVDKESKRQSDEAISQNSKAQAFKDYLIGGIMVATIALAALLGTYFAQWGKMKRDTADNSRVGAIKRTSIMCVSLLVLTILGTTIPLAVLPSGCAYPFSAGQALKSGLLSYIIPAVTILLSWVVVIIMIPKAKVVKATENHKEERN